MKHDFNNEKAWYEIYEGVSKHLDVDLDLAEHQELREMMYDTFNIALSIVRDDGYDNEEQLWYKVEGRISDDVGCDLAYYPELQDVAFQTFTRLFELIK